MEIEFHTMVVNGGDGSAHVRVFGTREQAAAAEAKEEEDYGEGWAEPSVQTHKITIDENGKPQTDDPTGEL